MFLHIFQPNTIVLTVFFQNGLSFVEKFLNFVFSKNLIGFSLGKSKNEAHGEVRNARKEKRFEPPY